MFFFLPRSLIFLVLFLGEKKKEKKEKKENVCNRNNLLAFCQVLKRRVVFRVIFSFFFNFFFFSFNPERKRNYGQSYDSFIFVQ